ncbi:MAG: carbohydrate ABC transporter permease [Bifidobacteriaceae bacterium]|jgi:multiple sugar transport system permease protein|nr:carbohydrate ABC transporter permease [Bifidobacteriaceae bacterium]
MSAARGGRRMTRVAHHTVLIGFGLVMSTPLLFALFVSLLDPTAYPFKGGPVRFTLGNYAFVMSNAPIGRWYLNTLVVTACVVAGAVVVNTLAGYALARFRFRGRQAVFLGIIAILMVPLQAYLIPLYLQITELGWLNTLTALIVPFIVNPLLIFLMRQSFSALPAELADAAAIDGAGRLRTFLRIGVPLTITGIATQAILSATWMWNSFMVPVTMTNKPELFVLTVGLNSLQSQHYTLPTVQMAGVVLLTVPVVVMFIAFQRYIVPSIASTGIKA